MNKLNFSSDAFNPLEHLRQSTTTSGEPAYEPYVKDGVVVVENEHIVYVPKVHLDSNALRDWFYKAFPDGRVEVIDRTAPPAFNQQDGSWCYPIEKYEVRLYTDKQDTNYKANGFGSCEPTKKEQYSPTTSAISYAFINAMRNMGAGVDIDFAQLMDELPKFIEIMGPLVAEGAPSQFKPLVSVLAEPKEKEIEQQEGPSVQPEGTEQAPTPAPTKASKKSSAKEKDLSPLEYIQRKQGKAASESPDPVLSANQSTSSPAESPDAYASMTAEEAGEIVFSTIPSYSGNLQDKNGKTLKELKASDEKFVRMIGRPTWKWEDKIPAQVRKAAEILVAESN